MELRTYINSTSTPLFNNYLDLNSYLLNANWYNDFNETFSFTNYVETSREHNKSS